MFLARNEQKAPSTSEPIFMPGFGKISGITMVIGAGILNLDHLKIFHIRNRRCFESVFWKKLEETKQRGNNGQSWNHWWIGFE